MNNVGSLSEMFNSSVTVLTKPSISTFEMYERRGNLQSALLYVGVAAVVAALFGLLGGLSPETSALGGAIGGFLSVFISFLLFTGTVFYVGKSQGGTGTFDEVAYTFSLFHVPLSLIASIGTLILTITLVGICLVPFLALAVLIFEVYLGYLAVQSSMNLTDRTKAWLTLGAAAIVTFVGNILINMIT